MFVMFDCCILQFIKNNCCRFNLEIMTFIFILIFLTRNICLSFQLSIETRRLLRNSEYYFSNY
jgi:hypothetical protein